MSVLIVIPARMQATRLPGKPLAEIGGVPMIVQVWRRAMEAKVGDVVTVTGVVRLDKDFGAGYVYKVLIEDGSIQP